MPVITLLRLDGKGVIHVYTEFYSRADACER